jgi:hypothetical protein
MILTVWFMVKLFGALPLFQDAGDQHGAALFDLAQD